MGCSHLKSGTNTPSLHHDDGDHAHAQLHTYKSPFLPQEQSDDCTPLPQRRNYDADDDVLNNNDKFHNPQTNPKEFIAMIILNSPIAHPPSEIFKKLWKSSLLRICADGGANRLYDATVLHHDGDKCDSPESYIPDFICGDLDSVNTTVKTYYEQRGVDIIQDTSQDYNDLDKALSAIQNWKLKKLTRKNAKLLQDEKSDQHFASQGENVLVQIFVFGAFGGRFDQEMASIQAMYRWRDEFHYRIALYSDETFAILLKPQVTNEIYLPFYSKGILNQGNNDCDDVVDDDDDDCDNHDANNNIAKLSFGEGPTCGLIPIGCRCEGVKTKGFKWNLDGSVPLEFGGLISTSNRAEERVLQIESPQPLVFTAEVVVQK